MTSARSATVKRHRAAMTPKQRVLKQYPLAYCARGVFRFTVWRDHCGRKNLGGGNSAEQAWADAARRLK